MLEAIVYRLRAKNTARIPLVHGRLMHAAFFSLLQEFNPELSAEIHDLQTQKPFTISELQKIRKSSRMGHTSPSLKITENTLLDWRVTAWDRRIIDCLQSLRPGFSFRIGSLELEVTDCAMSPAQHPDSGLLRREDLVAGCRFVPKIREITFSFLSPVSFRFFDRDYPWPLPEYVFGSLADKWSIGNPPFPIDRSDLREIARSLSPCRWHGQSRTVYFKADRGTLGFVGEFSYSVAHLPPEEQRLLLLLSKFAVFSGVGRLTGHGLGQVRTRYC